VNPEGEKGKERKGCGREDLQKRKDLKGTMY